MIRFGISGCGGFVERAVLPMMQRTGNARAVAAFDASSERTNAVCEKFGIAEACSSFEELILKSDVDAVYIASPNVLHKPQTLAAAEAGKHVFCQKPLAINAADCREMIRACKANGVKLGVGFCNRFAGAQERSRELIIGGAVGKLSEIVFAFNLLGYNPETVGWRCDPKMAGGGPLMDLAPHVVDLIGWFAGEKIESVMAYVFPQLSDTEIETDANVVMELSGGVRAYMDVSFGHKYGGARYSILGDKGIIAGAGTVPWVTNGQRVGTLTIETEEGTRDIEFHTREHIEEEIRRYCDAIEHDNEPPVTGEDGLRAQAVIDAIYESARTGKRCQVEL